MGTKTISKRQEAYNMILTTAIEGGINYWAFCQEYQWCDEDGNDLPEVTATIKDLEDGRVHYLDQSVIARGLSRLAREIEMSTHGRRYWRTAYKDAATNDFDFDVADADRIVQVGLFNEIVYC